MTHPAAAPPVEVMWRPGCPFCGSLRRGLKRAGIATLEHDIWSSPEAAVRVRAAAGGNETVPTVFVAGQALVNPSVRQVQAAIRAASPEGQDMPAAAAGQPSSRAQRILGRIAFWR